jgi:RNA polymerase sigma factor (sigma-70 family)
MQHSETAFNELQLRHELKVYLFIRSHILRNEDAENLCQDTFLKALHALRHKLYVPQEHFLAWLLAIAANEVHDFIKHKINTTKAQMDEGLEETLPAPPITYSDPHLRALLGRALDSLNEKNKHILIRHAVEEKTFEEIGEEMHLQEEAVKKRFHRTCDKLKKVLWFLKEKF